MSANKLLEFLDKWGKYVGFLTAVAGLVSLFADERIVSLVLLLVGWLLISLWLIGILREKPIQSRIILPDNVVSPTHKRKRKIAGLLLIIVNIVFLGFIFQFAYDYFIFTSKPIILLMITPTATPYEYTIVLSPFSLGNNSITKAPNSVDVQDLIYRDLSRTISRLDLSKEVTIVKYDTVLTSDVEARKIGESYDANLVIWGYVPTEHSNVFRPTFSFISNTNEENKNDAVLFNIDVIGNEPEVMLTKRASTVTSYVLALIYLDKGGTQNYAKALPIINQSIQDALNEYNLNVSSQSDLSYSLALLYLTRGRLYAALDKSDDALSDYQRALSYWSDYPRAYSAIGNVYYIRNDFAEAYKNYEMIQTKWYGMYGMGLVSYDQKNYTKAIYYFENAKLTAQEVDISEENRLNIDFALAMSYLAMGNKNKAEPLLASICASNENTYNRYSYCKSLLIPTKLPTKKPNQPDN